MLCDKLSFYVLIGIFSLPIPHVCFNFAIFVTTMQPLAERMRPLTLDNYIGQQHLVGPGAVLRRMVESGRVSSFILWGPPGVGKTTLACIIARKLEVPFFTLSAVTSGVKDVRDVIDKARNSTFFNASRPILFIDEIHTIVGAGSAPGSMDAANILKPYLTEGKIRVIGATTADEFRKHVESDAAFMRRFQKIDVSEPSPKSQIYSSHLSLVDKLSLVT
mgnify:CR=1 FL=1